MRKKIITGLLTICLAATCVGCNKKEQTVKPIEYSTLVGTAEGSVDFEDEENPNIDIKEIRSYIGQNIDFSSGVTITNMEKFDDFQMWVDATNVDIYTVGKYTATYRFVYGGKEVSKTVGVSIIEQEESMESGNNHAGNDSAGNHTNSNASDTGNSSGNNSTQNNNNQNTSEENNDTPSGSGGDNNNTVNNNSENTNTENNNTQSNNSGNTNTENNNSGNTNTQNNNSGNSNTENNNSGNTNTQNNNSSGNTNTQNNNNSGNNNTQNNNSGNTNTQNNNSGNNNTQNNNSGNNSTQNNNSGNNSTQSNNSGGNNNENSTTGKKEMVTTSQTGTVPLKTVGYTNIELLSGKYVKIKCTNKRYIVSTRTDITQTTKDNQNYNVSKLIITFNTGDEQVLETVEEKVK